MPESYWTLELPGRQKEKYSTKEEATEAAKKYLRENPSETRVPVHEMDEHGLGKRGRMIFRFGEYFHYVDTEWVK